MSSPADSPDPNLPDRERPAGAERVRHVLVGTLSGGNLGSAARALKNLGFTRWSAVDPRCDPAGREARDMAVHARDLLERLDVHDTLDAALEGATVVLGTSRRTGKHRVPHWRLDELRPQLERWQDEQVAVVYGREDSGLTDEELDRCTHLVHLPSSTDYPSFNLAQAVLLVAYELHLVGAGPGDDPHAGRPPATHAERQALYAHWERALRTIGFVHDDTATQILRRFRRLFGRARLRSDEAVLLRGLARQTLWAAGQSGRAADAGGEDDASCDPPS